MKGVSKDDLKKNIEEEFVKSKSFNLYQFINKF